MWKDADTFMRNTDVTHITESVVVICFEYTCIQFDNNKANNNNNQRNKSKVQRITNNESNRVAIVLLPATTV